MNARLEPKKADDIWNYTKKASILLADLTNKNSNLFYELGLPSVNGVCIFRMITGEVEGITLEKVINWIHLTL